MDFSEETRNPLHTVLNKTFGNWRTRIFDPKELIFGGIGPHPEAFRKLRVTEKSAS